MVWLTLAAAAQTPPDAVGGYDVGDVAVVRLVGDAFSGGFDVAGPVLESPFDRAMLEALERRATQYDFAMVFIGEDLPRQIQGALAFNRTYDRDVAGTGRWEVAYGPDVQSGLYMNRTEVWDYFDDSLSQWVFNHEVGHHWLAYLRVDLEVDNSIALLGRQTAHWSYFLHTGNAPMEGNAWIDNGDGTFTTDPDAGPGGYSDLELYVMGLLPPEEVRPFYLIDPSDPNGRVAASAPDPWAGQTATTVSGTRIDLSIDDIVAANGVVTPGPAESQREFSFLTILVVGPDDPVSPDDLSRIAALQTLWGTGFHEATRTLASISFEVVDEGLTVPPIEAPTWIPEAAQ